MQSITTWNFRPDEPLEICKRFANLEGTALLYSGGLLDSAKTSFLCLFPDDKVTLSASPTCWEQLQKQLGEFDTQALPIPHWVGYFGYEMGCFADRDVIIKYTASKTPDCCFYRPTVVIEYNHLSQTATLYAKHPRVHLEHFDSNKQPVEELTLGYSSDDLESYLNKIARAKEWILDGEIYQVNLSQEFHLHGKTSAFVHFENVARLNPAPFSAYLNCGHFCLVSSSPERFLSKKGLKLETRPIKGTFPRGKTPEKDLQNRKALLESEKEKAELLMITDLMRNDLGKVCLPGSVKTREIWRCEAYTNVFHLVSIIEGQCYQNISAVSLVRSLFPSGSITGCPKLRAMEAIAELEQRPRGIYTGSIGYFAANADFDFNIAIRTLVVHQDSVCIQLGGAIVMDSDPIKEFEETLHKGQSLFTVLGTKELLIS